MDSHSQIVTEQLKEFEVIEKKTGNDTVCFSYQDKTLPNAKPYIGTAQAFSKGEDFLGLSNELKSFSQLSPEAQEIATELTFEKMQNTYGDTQQGSTGCVVSILPSVENKVEEDFPKKFTLITGNVGDSPAWLITLSSAGNTIERLNTSHTCKNPQEKKKVILNSGEISDNNRVKFFENNSPRFLEPTRTLGDKHVIGTSREPDVTRREVIIEKGQFVYVILASDGILCNRQASDRNILDIVVRYHAQLPSEIAKQLVNSTTTKSFNSVVVPDDTSIIVVAMPIPIPLSILVCDGHGGLPSLGEKYWHNQVSSNVSKNFFNVLAEQATSLLNKDFLSSEKQRLFDKKEAIRQKEEKSQRSIDIFKSISSLKLPYWCFFSPENKDDENGRLYFYVKKNEHQYKQLMDSLEQLAEKYILSSDRYMCCYDHEIKNYSRTPCLSIRCYDTEKNQIKDPEEIKKFIDSTVELLTLNTNLLKSADFENSCIQLTLDSKILQQAVFQLFLKEFSADVSEVKTITKHEGSVSFLFQPKRHNSSLETFLKLFWYPTKKQRDAALYLIHRANHKEEYYKDCCFYFWAVSRKKRCSDAFNILKKEDTNKLEEKDVANKQKPLIINDQSGSIQHYSQIVPGRR